MTDEKKCQVCEKPSKELTNCKSCGRDYCKKCQSPSTHHNFCNQCVAMAGVVSKD
jgi:hypothetical protein